MGIVAKVGQGFTDFGKGIKVIFGKPSVDGGGDRKLAKVSLIVEEMITSQTMHEMRRRIIKDIEKTLGKEARKGGKEAVNAKVAISLATPEYMRLLHRVGLEESHVQILVMEALKNGKK